MVLRYFIVCRTQCSMQLLETLFVECIRAAHTNSSCHGRFIQSSDADRMATAKPFAHVVDAYFVFQTIFHSKAQFLSRNVLVWFGNGLNERDLLYPSCTNPLSYILVRKPNTYARRFNWLLFVRVFPFIHSA